MFLGTLHSLYFCCSSLLYHRFFHKIYFLYYSFSPQTFSLPNELWLISYMSALINKYYFWWYVLRGAIYVLLISLLYPVPYTGLIHNDFLVRLSSKVYRDPSKFLNSNHLPPFRFLSQIELCSLFKDLLQAAAILGIFWYWLHYRLLLFSGQAQVLLPVWLEYFYLRLFPIQTFLLTSMNL